MKVVEGVKGLQQVAPEEAEEIQACIMELFLVVHEYRPKVFLSALATVLADCIVCCAKPGHQGKLSNQITSGITQAVQLRTVDEAKAS